MHGFHVPALLPPTPLPYLNPNLFRCNPNSSFPRCFLLQGLWLPGQLPWPLLMASCNSGIFVLWFSSIHYKLGFVVCWNYCFLCQQSGLKARLLLCACILVIVTMAGFEGVEVALEVWNSAVSCFVVLFVHGFVGSLQWAKVALRVWNFWCFHSLVLFYIYFSDLIGICISRHCNNF